MLSYEQFAEQLTIAAASCPTKLDAIVAEAAEGGAEYAKDLIGHQQPSWQPLAESTIRQKGRLGFRAPDFEPLLRTGEMRDSIKGISNGLTGTIGSDDPTLLWQELGTATIPPRPVTPLAVIDYVIPFLEVQCGALAETLLNPKAAT